MLTWMLSEGGGVDPNLRRNMRWRRETLGGIAQSYFDIASPCKVAIQSTEVVEISGIIRQISPNIPVEPLL